MYRISADIRRLDGPLAGMAIPNGYTLTCPDEDSARRVVEFIGHARGSTEFAFVGTTCSRVLFLSGARVTVEGGPDESALPLWHRTDGPALCRLAMAEARAYNDALGEVMRVLCPTPDSEG